MGAFLLRGALAAIGLWVATLLLDGVRYDAPLTLLLAGLLLGVVNAIVRPLAVVLTLPITFLTLGLFLLVINAGMVAFVAWLLPGLHVAGFWSALLAAIVVSIVGGVGQALKGR
ncbi:MAG: phage holin family protein [Steroidobacteraceae bacterium]|jgi:putative membrane protein|nr:phage holin family protein [Steroidobacteraceae bacterium]